MPPEPLAMADRASRRYGKGDAATQALRSATCAVFPADRIALVGPSGSGKSTLLHLLSGLDRPTGGSVTWPALGERAALHPRLVADIFQGPSLLPPLTVLQNVRLPMALAGLSDAEATERALEALSAFAVDHLRDKLPEEISGGQAQRVSIARTVALRPRLVLADEPTGQLDSVTAKRVLATLFDRLDARGAALVLATHDPALAERCALTWRMTDGILTTGTGETTILVNEHAPSLTVS